MKKIVLSIVITLFTLTSIYSIINIIIWNKEKNITNTEINNIKENVIINEINDDNTIKDKYIDVEFESLLMTNKDTKGWIQLNGTNINYPYVQTSNNDYYLNHSFEGKKSKAGWIFLDYRNNSDFTDTNTIIYGHNRFDNSMFGSLKNTLKKKWFNNKENHIIKISTKKDNTIWQIFSIYKIKTTIDYLLINFDDEDKYNNFINLIKDRSIYDFKTDVNNNDKILTLSTCSGSKYKLVVHAKLINTQNNKEE